MTVAEVVREIEVAGAALRLDGEKILVSYPNDERRKELAEQIALLRAQRAEVAAYLKARRALPRMPYGVRLVRWETKPAPVTLTNVEVVIDVARFVAMTVLELKAALAGKPYLSGHRSVHELIDRLKQCGVVVEVKRATR